MMGTQHIVWIFGLTAGLLLLVRETSPLPVLLADRYLPGSGVLQILVLGIYACFIGHKLLNAAQTGPIRSKIWAFFSVVFFAQLLLGLSGMPSMLMTGELHAPVPALILAGPVYRGHGLFMPILYAITVLLVGPAWCSYLCYIGAWDDIASRWNSKNPRPVPKWATHILRAMLAMLIVGSAWLLRLSNAPLPVAVGLALGFGLTGVGTMICVSTWMGRMFHCTVICPIGLISNLVGRISPWQVRIGQGCTLCSRCSRACRYGALEENDLNQGRPGLTCTLCGDCIGQCPNGLIGYRFSGMRPEQARTAFIILIVSIHTLFLGVARI
jgi:polyferredoxin